MSFFDGDVFVKNSEKELCLIKRPQGYLHYSKNYVEGGVYMKLLNSTSSLLSIASVLSSSFFYRSSPLTQ